MDATLLEQIRHLCRDRAAYERLKAILVQQERLHQLSWEERYKNLVPANLAPAIGADAGADAGVAVTSDRLTESEDLTINGTANFGQVSEVNNLLTNIIIREKAIAQLTDAIQRSPSLDLVLQIAVQVAQKLLQVDRVAIFRRHTDGRGEFITDAIAAGVTSLADMPERQLSLARHLTESVTVEHNAQTVDNIRSSTLSSHIVTVLEQIGISSYAANKIYAGQELWGTLVAFHGSFYHGWTESDRTSLGLVASQISIAIAIAHLRQQSQTLSSDVKSLQNELDKLQTTVSEIVEQQNLIKTKGELLNDSIDELIEYPTQESIEQDQALPSNIISEEVSQELSEKLVAEVIQEYTDASVEVIQDEINIPIEQEQVKNLNPENLDSENLGSENLGSEDSNLENIHLENINETEAIAVEVIQSEEISKDTDFLFGVNSLSTENTYLSDLSERSFQDIPQDIQEHISEWLGQEPLASDQSINQKDDDESSADLVSVEHDLNADIVLADAIASNTVEIIESRSEDAQESINDGRDSLAIIITDASNDLETNLERDYEENAQDIIGDSIQELSQDVVVENDVAMTVSNGNSVDNNIEMIEDITITFPISRNGLPRLYLVEQHNQLTEDLSDVENESENNIEVIDEIADERTENIPQSIEPLSSSLATSHLSIASDDDSSDDRDPAIEPQFMETILAIAGNGAKAHEFLLDVIDDYLEETPRLVQSIDRAIATNEQAKLLQLLNTLRTASEYIGALSVAYQCRQLESAVRANYVVLIYASLSQVAIESQRALDALRIERSRHSS